MTLPERVFGGSAMNIYAFLPINPLFHASKTRTPGKPTGAPEICISFPIAIARPHEDRYSFRTSAREYS